MRKLFTSVFVLLLLMTVVRNDNVACLAEDLNTNEDKFDWKDSSAYEGTEEGERYLYKDSVGNEYELWITEDNILTHIFSVEKNIVLKEIIIPDNIRAVYGEGFNYVEVEKIYIPASVEYILPGAILFSRAVEFIVDGNNPNYCSVEGVVYTKDMKVMLGYPGNRESKLYHMPETVEIMWQGWIFESPTNLEYIIYSSSLDYLSTFPYGGKSVCFPTDMMLEEKDLSYTMEEYRYYFEYEKHEDEPMLVYLTAESPYIESFSNDSAWLPIVEDNYNLRHALMALKMALGIYETQLDLRAYEKTGEEKLLFDETKDEQIDLEDAKCILEKALGIE